MAALKWHPALDFGDLHIIRIQSPIISRASPILLLYRFFDCASEVATNGTTHGCDGVEVFMANNFEPVADHRVEGFGRVHEFDRELHCFAFHATPDRRLHC